MMKVKERALAWSVRALVFEAGMRGSLLFSAEKLSILAMPYLSVRGSVLCSWGFFHHRAQSRGSRMVFLVPWHFCIKCSWVKDEMKTTGIMLWECAYLWRKDCWVFFFGGCFFLLKWCLFSFINFFGIFRFFSFTRCYGVEISNTGIPFSSPSWQWEVTSPPPFQRWGNMTGSVQRPMGASGRWEQKCSVSLLGWSI